MRLPIVEAQRTVRSGPMKSSNPSDAHSSSSSKDSDGVVPDEWVRFVMGEFGLTEAQARSTLSPEGFSMKTALAFHDAPWPPFRPDIVDLDELPPDMAARAAARSQQR